MVEFDPSEVSDMLVMVPAVVVSTRVECVCTQSFVGA